ncbi:MAG: peptidylprolyl isomerase [Spiribacter sp.]|jgi:Parvulin-like peptidyl-prolyl isomerase|nr:peptidylprolyl isomerase [Spiribacter sp.]MDR9479909.1 peptidylprolyl isomerase [Spiribacter sp.]
MVQSPAILTRALLAATLSLSASITLAQDNAANTTVLAQINGEPVTERELNQLIARQTQGQTDLPAVQRRQFLQEMINLMLLSQAGETAGVDDNPDVSAQLQNSRRTTLAQAFVRDLTTAEPVDEARLRERYQQAYVDNPSQEYRARHILVQEKAQAEGLITRLNDGEAFADLAQQYSEDGSAEQGGDLGWFSSSDMVSAFGDAVAALETGSLTQAPVETRFGWHVIQLDDTREVATPAFSEVAEELRRRVINERIQARIDALRGDAQIDYSAGWASPEQ